MPATSRSSPPGKRLALHCGHTNEDRRNFISPGFVLIRFVPRPLLRMRIPQKHTAGSDPRPEPIPSSSFSNTLAPAKSTAARRANSQDSRSAPRSLEARSKKASHFGALFDGDFSPFFPSKASSNSRSSSPKRSVNSACSEQSAWPACGSASGQPSCHFPYGYKSSKAPDADIGLFEQSLVLLLGCGIRTAPHIVAGLDHGRILGEYEALRVVARSGVSALVLVVLMPLDGTPMEDAEGPSLQELHRLFRHARSLMDDRPIYPGCARPGGRRGTEIGRLALEFGFDGISFPSVEVARRAKDLGFAPRYVETCCSL